MENNELTTREKLKTYFETGKYPTESQFAELIDSLKFKEDVLTNKEAIILANSLATMDNGYIQYIVRDDKDVKFQIVISKNDEEDQVIEIRNTYGYEKIQYFFGNAPYTVKVKEFPTEGLGEVEYYNLRYQINEDIIFSKIFGNNLPNIPSGFELGTMKEKRLYIQINTIVFAQKINIINTHIQLTNKTEVSIRYRPVTNYWSYPFTSKDIITDHYDIDDYFTFYFNADLREINKAIECKFYDVDNGNLLMTNYLTAGYEHKNAWGAELWGVRNLRIECDYQIIEN